MSENDYPNMEDKTLRACVELVDFDNPVDIEQALSAARELIVRRNASIDSRDLDIEKHEERIAELETKLTELEGANKALRDRCAMLQSRDTPTWREHAERADAKVVELEARQLKCSICDKPATCMGVCENNWAYACDECCGHGGEDGECWGLMDLPRAFAGQRKYLHSAEDHCVRLIKRAEKAEAERDRFQRLYESTQDSRFMASSRFQTATHLFDAYEVLEGKLDQAHGLLREFVEVYRIPHSSLQRDTFISAVVSKAQALLKEAPDAS